MTKRVATEIRCQQNLSLLSRAHNISTVAIQAHKHTQKINTSPLNNMIRAQIILLSLALLCNNSIAFAPIRVSTTQNIGQSSTRHSNGFSKSSLHMSEVEESSSPAVAEEEPEMDEATKLQMEKQKRADELRAQEVFMQRSTGIHKCTVCDWEFDEKKGDAYLIGGQIQPGTPFSELPSNWRCPSCRASKDNFQEVTEEIPGFAVNQGYGLGGNGMTSGQKSGLVFGGLGLFFLLFLAGYGLS